MPASKAAKYRPAKRPTKIKVIGLGGVGLCLLPTLCRFLNYGDFPSVEVHLIDGDEFEERDRDRQDFTVTGPKASVVADEYREKFPRIMFWDHPVFLAEQNVIAFIRENDLVFVCVNNHRTRKLVSDRAEQLESITVISGGNDYTDGNVQVHVRQDGKNLTLPLANKYHPERRPIRGSGMLCQRLMPPCGFSCRTRSPYSSIRSRAATTDDTSTFLIAPRSPSIKASCSTDSGGGASR
jgi:hypothetical protein